MSAAAHDFPSAAWVAAYEDAINKSQEYRAASTDWTHGSVALVMPAQPAIGVPDDVGIWLAGAGIILRHHHVHHFPKIYSGAGQTGIQKLVVARGGQGGPDAPVLQGSE